MAAVGGGGGAEFSFPMNSIPDNAFAGVVVNGRALLWLLDQMELLNGVVVDHRLLELPSIDCNTKH